MDRATAAKAGARANKGYSFNFKPHSSSLAYQKNLITAQEMEENFVKADNGGTFFRLKLFGVLVVAILGIGYLKYDVEYNLQPHNGNQADDLTVVDPVARRYYEQLNVPMNEPSVGDHEDGSQRVLTEQEIRRERHRLRKAAEKAFEQQTVEHHSLVHCGDRCERQYNQMKMAYDKINQKLDRNLYDVLGVKQNEPLNAQQLAGRAQSLQKEIEEAAISYSGTEEQRELELEDKEIALQDLRDAYDILSQPDSRIFYNLYGLRPPEDMKHVSARSGGWGQEFAFSRAYHVKLALMFLKYVDSYALDILALVSCILFVAFAMWRKYPELRAIAEKVEEHERRMKELAEREKFLYLIEFWDYITWSMLHGQGVILANHRVTYIPACKMGRPSCPRWDLRLTRARLFGEYIDPKIPGSWQIEDHRDLDPTHGRFIGRAEDRFHPSASGGDGAPDQILQRTLPQYTVHEFYNRTQVPWNENVLYGKSLAEKTFMGTTVPYGYTLYKQLQRAGRNDRKIHPNFTYPITSGYLNSPKKFNPIPDATPAKNDKGKGTLGKSDLPLRKTRSPL